ncbi:hypothetical protein Pla123a_30830 [Posidoniimonas polymericola]|uniref:Uncharacterized protein n=1 Tax=Posidoniimonas polymericola TaxID=2528002 RepID=A0A5C5YKY0_9BACT|nr:hypothetical protein Pla123a_30830 [Posidoniimonas polymericola]
MPALSGNVSDAGSVTPDNEEKQNNLLRPKNRAICGSVHAKPAATRNTCEKPMAAGADTVEEEQLRRARPQR